VAAGGTIDPGTATTGILTLTGALTTTGGSATPVLRFDIGGLDRGTDYDAINGLTGLSLAGTLRVNLTGGFDPSLGTSFRLLDWAALSATLPNGYDNGLLFDLPTFGTLGEKTFSAADFFTTGNITVVPEPSRALLLMIGIIGLLMRRRRPASL